MTTNIILAEGVNRSFPISGGKPFHALKDIKLSVPENSLTILKGRSGSGKTTLINILGALDLPNSGKISICGSEITSISERKRENIRRKNIGYVFQSVSLIPMMSAFENVEFALRLAGIRKDRKKRVEECLKMVGLGGRMHHMPQELSGGEQQRVAIARAVAHNPKVVFADEPTAELDSVTSVAVVNLFKEMVKNQGITIVMTTHDVSLMDAGDFVYELEDGELKDV
ncbi:MAG TPA: ABC transporter ATP-binding protein [Lachnospiraceae bacterium]|nr:ABC transporter ATP-binding protein [Lachnospiraceae bacterium]